MKLLLRLALRGAVVSSLLMLGCIHGHRPSTSSSIAIVEVRPPTTNPVLRPLIKIIEVSPVSGTAEEQENAALMPPVVRASCDDTTSPSVPFGHAPDHRWLIGELHYSPARGAWCLHYAAPEEQDAHGGSVTLIGGEPFSAFHSGQAVRVEGELIDPDSLEPSPPYRVRGLRPWPDGEKSIVRTRGRG